MIISKIPFKRIYRPNVCRFSTKKTFENQSRLPKLPIPSLEATQEKYLKSCRPLLQPDEYETTKQAVLEFTKPEGLGPVLQQRLEEYGAQQKNSWLEDIWLNKAYLEWREPSLINVNWWCQFKDHPTHPTHLLVHPPPKGVVTEFQIDRAAGLVFSLLEFKRLLDTESLAPDYIKDTPLCMNQYRNQFGTTRIPGETKDSLVTVHPCTSPFIIVSIRNQLYKIVVVDEQGQFASIKELKRLMYAASKNSLETDKEPPIGLLTAGHRDTWFKAHQLLMKQSQNEQNLKFIQDALFVLCLDDFSVSKNIDVSHHQIFHNFDARNRWFDKAIQLIVASNGRAGVNGEHSPADAVIPGKMMDFLVERELNAKESIVENTSRMPEPIKLTWKIDEQIKNLILEAQNTANALISDTQSCLLQTDLYGSRYIKEVAKCSPDAYVQMVLLLTWQRLHKVPTAVYETASTRAFHHGRTETVRSLTSETWDMAKNFDNDEMLIKDKTLLFRKALESQTAYMKDASKGMGVDRHLLGLRCMIETKQEGEMATLFNDPAYIKSMYFKLSTSNMSPGKNFYGGFGPVVPEGYGINYAIGKDELKFSISSKRSCQETDSYKFRDTLLRTLKDVMELFPKRSQIWGMDWKEKQMKEKKESIAFKKMQDLSDAFPSKKQ